MKANKLKKLVSAAFAFCVAALYAELPDPLVWFKMDALNENGGVDSVGTVADKTLTLTGGITLVDDAEMGKVLEFAGGASDRGNFYCPPLSSRTISLWFWRDRTNGDLTGDYPYVFQDLSGSGMNYGKNGNSVSLIQSGISSVDGRAICRDSWHHVAITIDTSANPAAIKIFEDGVCVRSATASAAIPEATKDSSAFIGNLNGNMGRPFKGRMFDFRVYGTALTGAQVGEIAADGLAKRGPCLISHWPFETIEDGKTPEVTGYGTALTLGAGMSLANDGVDGKALRFYSADAKGLGATSTLPAVELYGHTWTCWIRRSSKAPELHAVSANPYPRFIALDQGTFVQLADSAVVNWRNIAVNPNRNATSTVTTKASYGTADADVWGHLAVVIRVVDGTTSTVSAKADVYLNGEKVTMSPNDTFSYWNALTLASNGFCLGNTGVGNNRYFCGDMDDLRLYDCALSDDEVRRVYRGLAGISAGADCSVAAETAVLRGTVATGSGNGVSSGFAGKTFWTLVSAPQGGEAAAIGNPLAPETSVTLPVPGEYVFRLTISDLGVSKFDDVTVTRVAPESGNVPPTIVLDSEVSVELPAKLALAATVTDDDEGPSAVRVCWTKKSGPGGVWFTPENAAATTADFSAAGTYVLVCTADDGQDAATREITVTVTGSIDGSTIRNGLGRFWKLDGGDEGLTHGGDGPFAAWSFENGVEGLAAHPLGHKTYFATGVTAFPGEEGGTANTACQNDFITVSAWVHVDSNTTNAWFRSAVIGKRNTFALRLKEKKSGRWGTQYPGFAIYQQGTGGTVTRYFYPELTADQKDRWLHVCAVVDRKAGKAMEMWYDGVQQAAVDSEGAAGGRYNANGITIGGEPYAEANSGNTAYTSDYNVNYPKNINQDSPTAGQYYSNTFPGKIDNVGIWSRKLSGDEIRYLAAHPAMGVDRGPSVAMTVPEKVEKRTANEVVVSAFADIPLESGKALTYSWQVISPNAANASFDDPTKASPKLTVTKAGVYVVQVAVSDGERTVYSRVASVPCDKPGLMVIMR